MMCSQLDETLFEVVSVVEKGTWLIVTGLQLEIIVQNNDMIYLILQTIMPINMEH